MGLKTEVGRGMEPALVCDGKSVCKFELCVRSLS